jgi:hypothetical protein
MLHRDVRWHVFSNDELRPAPRTHTFSGNKAATYPNEPFRIETCVCWVFLRSKQSPGAIVREANVVRLCVPVPASVFPQNETAFASGQNVHGARLHRWS